MEIGDIVVGMYHLGRRFRTFAAWGDSLVRGPASRGDDQYFESTSFVEPSTPIQNGTWGSIKRWFQ